MSRKQITLKVDKAAVQKMFSAAKYDIHKTGRETVIELTMDFTRTSSGLAPIKTGKLQDSYTNRFVDKGPVFEGITTYKALNKGYNYAVPMNDKQYNLGKRSQLKRPARSKFAKTPRAVGTGYATGLFEDCRQGYHQHMKDRISQVCKKYKR